MGKPINIQNTIGNRITAVHLVLFTVMLPFDRFYTELILISLVLHTIVQYRNLPGMRMLNLHLLLVPAVYLANLISIIYTRDTSEALSEAVKQLALLLIPALFVINPNPVRKYKHLILNVFAYSCVFTISYLYFDAIHTIYYYHLTWNTLFTQTFMNHNFSMPLELHATYLSMYVALSFIYLFDQLVQTKKRGRQRLYTIGLAILFCGLLQLASRSVFIYFLGFFTLVVPFVYFEARRRLKAFITCFLLSVIVSLFMLLTPSFEERYVTGIRSDLSLSADTRHNNDPRGRRWALAIQLAGEAPLFGHGAGSERRLLADTYFEHKLYDSFLHQLNAHDQYLSILLKTGLFGLVIYLLALGLALRYAIKQKQILLLAFLLLVVTVSFTENILDVNKGIFFYSFFFSLFLTTGENYRLFKHSERQPQKRGDRLYKIIEHH